MNNDDERFGDLLRNVPFDDAYREQHRDDVCDRALRAFDEAAAAGSLTVASRPQPRRNRSVQRRVFQIAAIAALAASVCVAMVTWPGRFDDPVQSESPIRRPLVKSAVELRADHELLAAVSLLSELAADRAAATFDYGIEVCLMDRESQLAATNQ